MTITTATPPAAATIANYGRPITYLMGGSLVEVHSSSYFCLSHARTVFCMELGVLD
jgi:hypothetical protein